MLVLTRKAKEQILIGEDIKITIVRLQGNSVRIGIDAPREQRVIRGELEPSGLESDPLDLEECESAEFADQHRVFAHPQPNPSKTATLHQISFVFHWPNRKKALFNNRI